MSLSTVKSSGIPILQYITDSSAQFADPERMSDSGSDSESIDTSDDDVSSSTALENKILRICQDYGNLETIYHAEMLVEQTPPGDPDLPEYKRRLGEAWHVRYREEGDPKDLDPAFRNYEAAIQLAPPGHPTRAVCLQGLALCLQDKYRESGSLDDLEAALQCSQEAVLLTPEGHQCKPRYLHSLALCFRDRYRRLGNPDDLEAAVQRNQEAVNLTPEVCSDRVTFLHDLAVSFSDQYKRGSGLSDLSRALRSYEEAVKISPQDDPEKPELLRDLGESYMNLYQRLAAMRDLETALKRHQEAVDLAPEWHSNRAALLQNLAGCLRSRYYRLGDIRDLEAAVEKGQEAIKVASNGHPDTPVILGDLASSLQARYVRLGELDDLMAALENIQKAVDLTPAQHPNRPGFLTQLARVFADRYQRLGSLEDLEAAKKKYQKAIELWPEGHPGQVHALHGLAMSLMNRYRRLGHGKDLAAVHAHYISSFKITTDDPQGSWRAALQWASFAEETEPLYCLSAYTEGFALLPEMVWIGHSIPMRQAVLHGLNIEHATSSAVRVCTTYSKLTSALEIMEQGVATIFQQTLQLRTDVDELPMEQAQEFTRLSSELYSGTITDSTEIMDIVNRRTEVLAEIRQKPHLKNFLQPKPYNILRQAAQGGPVVILNSTGNHCDAILVLNPISDPVHIPLPNVKLELLKSNQARLRDLLGESNIRNRAQTTSTRLFGKQESFRTQTTEEGFADILSCLWVYIVAPVYQVLDAHGIHSGRLWWLPTGSFTGLPLHACPPNDKFIHSYTATLGSLANAYAKEEPNIANKVGIVGVAHGGSVDLSYLKGVKEEVGKIISIIPSAKVLEGQQATVDAVKQLLEHCSWLHFACHGKQDILEPTKSHLVLYGGDLALETILRMPLPHAKFVFLAACQSAMGDGELVNESFHLGGGFIAAGFRGAIGTLWSMDDRDGPLIAEVVYSHLFRTRCPKASNAAEALHIAIKALRSNKVPYERWIPFIHMGV